jgi:hypothetical protein
MDQRAAYVRGASRYTAGRSSSARGFTGSSADGARDIDRVIVVNDNYNRPTAERVICTQGQGLRPQLVRRQQIVSSSYVNDDLYSQTGRVKATDPGIGDTDEHYRPVAHLAIDLYGADRAKNEAHHSAGFDMLGSDGTSIHQSIYPSLHCIR